MTTGNPYVGGNAMKKSLVFFIIGFVVAVCVPVSSALAQQWVTVPDWSFEDHALAEGGYEYIGTASYTGAWESFIGEAWVDRGYYRVQEGYDEDLPGHTGRNKAYSNDGGTDYIYQILDETYIEGVTYTFSVWVGEPWGGSAGWTLYFTADGPVEDLIEVSGSSPLEWEQISITYTATTDDAGKKIGIKMKGDADVSFDDVTLTAKGDTRWAHDPTPADGATGVVLTGNTLTLSWKAGVDPLNPSIPNPNIIEHYLWLSAPYDVKNPEIPENPWDAPGVQQFTIPADGGSTASRIINGLQKNKVYLWIVDEGLTGSSGPLETDPAKIKWGDLWRFETELFDAPPVVDAGADMITWAGEPVQLDPNVIDDGSSAVTYLWTADPATGVAFDPSASVEAPTFTVDNPPVAVSIVNASFEDPVLGDRPMEHHKR